MPPWLEKINEHREYAIVASIFIYTGFGLAGHWKRRTSWYIALTLPEALLNVITYLGLLWANARAYWFIPLYVPFVVLDPAFLAFPIVCLTQICNAINGEKKNMNAYSSLFVTLLTAMYGWEVVVFKIADQMR